VENLFYESRIRVNGKKILKKSVQVNYKYTVYCSCMYTFLLRNVYKIFLYSFSDKYYMFLSSYMLEMR
jgi:hypothetical protein